MKKQKKEKSGSVKIDPSVLEEAKLYCKKNGVLISYYATEAIKDRLKKDTINEKQHD